MIRVASAQQRLPALLEPEPILRAAGLILPQAMSIHPQRRFGIRRIDIAQSPRMQAQAEIELGYFQMMIPRIIKPIRQTVLAAQQAEGMMHSQGVLRAVDAIVLHRHIADTGRIIAP